MISGYPISSRASSVLLAAKRGAEVRPDLSWNRSTVPAMGYRKYDVSDILFTRLSPRRTPPTRGGYLPRKPLARKAIPADIRSLCRSYTAESIRVLASIMRQPEHSDAARIQAANILLDRGWGRAPQARADED